MGNRRNLSGRKEDILKIIINSYVDTANPIGSVSVSREDGLGLSSATVRNEMAELEKMGYITHPHTSAGRIPTDKGYRYWIDNLIENESIPKEWAAEIEKLYRVKVKNVEELIEKTTRILSGISYQAGVVVFPCMADLYFKQVDFIKLGSKHILVVWLSESGVVFNQTVDLGSPVDIEFLGRLRSFFNTELAGRNFCEIEPFVLNKLYEARDSLRTLYERAMQIVKEGLEASDTERILMEGSANILNYPEFKDIEKSRILFSVLEDKVNLLKIFKSSMASETRVVIGRETRFPQVSECSAVIKGYRFKGRILGSLGLVGPKRMPYQRILPLVERISEIMSDVYERNF